ncbi:MAG: alpha/beta fold hydrolase [Acholeplasmatales bacterium]|nr:alpha/beta fold hydrolase [Acholeplasmatales bacterium]
MLDAWVIALIVIGVLLLIFIMIFVPPFFIALKVFKKELVRTDKSKWNRECSAPDNEEQLRMHNTGLEWAEPYKDSIKEVKIVNEGLNLYGEFFDFKSNKTAILLQGRTESLLYCYYYAKPYKDLGYNILVVDSRAHGLSDGIYNCVGLKEYKDIIAWAKYIHDEFSQEEIIIHGICIGASTALYASYYGPDYIKGVVTDGMYINFYETFKNHMIVDHRPIFPFLREIAFIMRLKAHVNIKKGPLNLIDKYEKPILFLYSKEDKFSLPAKSEILYNKCKSNKKKIVWFDHGAHSHIRINNLEKYDESIKEFLKENNL